MNIDLLKEIKKYLIGFDIPEEQIALMEKLIEENKEVNTIDHVKEIRNNKIFYNKNNYGLLSLTFKESSIFKLRIHLYDANQEIKYNVSCIKTETEQELDYRSKITIKK